MANFDTTLTSVATPTDLWPLQEITGSAAVNTQRPSNPGAYAGTPGTNYSLGQPSIIPGNPNSKSIRCIDASTIFNSALPGSHDEEGTQDFSYVLAYQPDLTVAANSYRRIYSGENSDQTAGHNLHLRANTESGNANKVAIERKTTTTTNIAMTASPISTGTSYLMIVTYGQLPGDFGKVLRLYLQGQESASTASTLSLPSHTSSFRVGSAGYYAYIARYGVCLTAPNVATLWNAFSVPPTAPPPSPTSPVNARFQEAAVSGTVSLTVTATVDANSTSAGITWQRNGSPQASPADDAIDASRNVSWTFTGLSMNDVITGTIEAKGPGGTSDPDLDFSRTIITNPAVLSPPTIASLTPLVVGSSVFLSWNLGGGQVTSETGTLTQNITPPAITVKPLYP